MKRFIRYIMFERIGYLTGWAVSVIVWFFVPFRYAFANFGNTIGIASTLTPTMILSALMGAVGSYLAFGEDRKFPPTTASLGHVLLGFGAGLFFTRGSLELMGHLNSSNDVILFASFLWAALGYFILRLLVSVANSAKTREMIPAWIARILGVK